MFRGSKSTGKPSNSQKTVLGSMLRQSNRGFEVFLSGCVARRVIYGVCLGLLGLYVVGRARCIAGGHWKGVFGIFWSKKCVFQGSQEAR